MDVSPSIVLWQSRHGHVQFRCVMEQLGEECFELRLFRGNKILIAESFEDPAPLLALADALRLDVDEPRHRQRAHALALH